MPMPPCLNCGMARTDLVDSMLQHLQHPWLYLPHTPSIISTQLSWGTCGRASSWGHVLQQDPDACAQLKDPRVFPLSIQFDVMMHYSWSHPICQFPLLHLPATSNQQPGNAVLLYHLPPSGMPLRSVWISFISVCTVQQGIACQLPYMCELRFEKRSKLSTGQFCGIETSTRILCMLLLL